MHATSFSDDVAPPAAAPAAAASDWNHAQPAADAHGAAPAPAAASTPADPVAAQKVMAHWADGGVELGRSRKSKVDDDEQSQSTTLKVDGDGARLGRGNEATYQQGTDKVKDKSKATVGVDWSGNAVVGGSSGRTVTRADKSSTGTELSGKLKIGKKAVGAEGGFSRTNKDAKGKVESQIKVSGGASIDTHGGIKNAHADASYKNKGSSVSGGASYEVSAGNPVKREDGTWEVSWKREKEGHGSAGYGAGSVGAEKGRTDFGTQIFSDAKEAAEFSKHPAAHSALMPAPPDSAAGALAMKVGEERGVEESSALKAGLKAPIAGPFSVGVDGKTTDTETRTVKKLSETEVEVSMATGNDLDGSASVGGAGAKLGVDKNVGDKHWKSYRFDLSTEEGKRAYAAYMKDGSVEAGAELYESGDNQHHAEGGGFTFSKGGVKAQMTDKGRVSNTVIQRGDDRIFDSTGDRDKNRSLDLPVVDFLDGKDNTSAGIHQQETNGAPVYQMVGSVYTSDGDWTRKGLADLTGAYTTGGPLSSHVSGKWTASSDLSQPEMAAFIARARAGKLDDSELLGKSRSGVNELVSRLRAAGDDMDAQMKATSEFVATYGAGAFEVIRGNLGYANQGQGKEQQFDLALAGDEHGVFRGREGRVESEGAIARFDDQLDAPDADAKTLYRDVYGELERQQQALDAIENEGNYTDLPQQLRAQQVTRIAGYVRRLEAQRDQAQHRLIGGGAIARGQTRARQRAEGDGAGVEAGKAQVRTTSMMLDTWTKMAQDARGRALEAHKAAMLASSGAGPAKWFFTHAHTLQAQADALDTQAHLAQADGAGSASDAEEATAEAQAISLRSREAALYNQAAGMYQKAGKAG